MKTDHKKAAIDHVRMYLKVSGMSPLDQMVTATRTVQHMWTFYLASGAEIQRLPRRKLIETLANALAFRDDTLFYDPLVYVTAYDLLLPVKRVRTPPLRQDMLTRHEQSPLPRGE